ncbi:amino acid adenylation domain-containing protein [Herbaspirillum sp. GCM10030257]|uniref:amino acid adenylation domain-containing protein n=1 Tax=Herbaspirillum sp. GCM10030257 TaxID=3273393 RepID=UPI00361CDEB3
MSLTNLLETLADASVRLKRDGDELVITFGHGAPDDATIAALRTNKAALLQFLDDRGGSWEPEPQAQSVPAGATLSFSQQRLWFLNQLQPGSAAYNEEFCVRLQGAINPPTLERALNTIVQRHDVLRTRFGNEDGRPTINVAEELALHLHRHDLSHMESSERMRTALELAGALVLQPFDPAVGPLLRANLIRLDSQDHLLQVCMHHMVSDGWSMRVLAGELVAIYQALSEGRENTLPKPEIQYVDYAAWQRANLEQGALQTQAAFWRKQLQGAPAVSTLPADRARPPLQDYDGASVDIEIDAGLTARLRQFSTRHQATLFMTVLAGWSALLSRLSGQNDLVVGSPVAGRGRAELEALIGFFANTLPLRIDLDGAPNAVELVRRAKATVIAAHDHQDLPFEYMVDSIKPARSTSHSPLFQLMLNWQTEVAGGIDFPSVKLSAVYTPYDIAKFDLTLRIVEEKHRLLARFEYATALFDRPTIERHARYLIRILQGMTENELVPMSTHQLIDSDERRQQVLEWNDTQAAFADSACIHQLFEIQARTHPEKLALVHDGIHFSYRELNARANRLARHLRQRGVGTDTPVAICMDRGCDMVVGLLAVLKAGGAYVPLDPAHPAERLAYAVRDSGAVLVLLHSSLDPSLRSMLDAACDAVLLDEQAGDWIDEPESDLDAAAIGLSASNLAYVIYTSGSTGQPKGVMVEHRGVVNLLQSIGHTVGMHADERVLALTTIAFDIAALELYLPLIHGARIVLCGRSDSADPVALGALLERHEISLMQATPATWRMLLSGGWAGATRLKALCGGEGLSRELARELALKVGRLWNVYGPTETTIWSTCAALGTDEERGTAAHAPIGRPLANTRVYLLDARQQLVPLGAAGELYIGGAGVARGYLGRPELNAERFVADCFAGDGTRMYRTGDLARYLPDGNLEFLGRSDFQVKLRGFRVELGEIEACMERHPDVREAAVLLQGSGDDDKRLVGYFIAAADASVDIASLRAYLAAFLPDYMVPAAVVALAEMPLTPNGKLDRKALPAAAPDAFARSAYVAPADDIEIALARIWSALLGIDRVSRLDHFFEAGGQSLLAVRLISRIRSELGVELHVTQVFAQPVLSDMAAMVRTAARSELPPVTPVSRDEPLPLSFAQQRLWFLSQLEHVSRAYNMGFALKLAGELDRPVLQRALDRLVERHEALRTVFLLADGQPRQRILSAAPGFPLEWVDLENDADATERVQVLMREEVAAPFDLERGPLARGRLIRTGKREHVLLCTMHHIVSDGWSVGVLTRELSALYRAFGSGEQDPLPPPAFQYADYALWQRRWSTAETLEEHAKYWTTTLADAPQRLALPTDRPRPAEQDYSGAFLETRIDEQLAHDLRALSQRHGTTLFMTLLAGWAVLLARLAGTDDLVIGTPVANRTRLEAEPLVGFFVNALALRLDLSGDPDVAEILARVKRRTLEAQEHQGLPFEHLVESLSPTRTLDHHPVFQASFTWQNNDEGAVSFPGMQVEVLQPPRLTTKFDLSLYLTEDEGGITGGIEYATALFDSATIARYLGYLHNILRAMAADQAATVSRIPLMNGAETHSVLGLDAVEAEPVDVVCVHESFEEHAHRHPEAVALVHGPVSVSYGELNSRANRLAHYLRRKGVAPDTCVALCLDRGVDLIVAILAVHKAGGAYVPLDPTYPADRLDYMLADSKSVVVLTHAGVKQASRAVLERASVPVIDLQEQESAWRQEPASNPDKANGAGPGHLAYVIYTSGSTGRPKGVLVEHRNVARLFTTIRDWFNYSASDVWTLFHSCAFDFSVWEIWGALAHGGRLVVVSHDTSRSPAQFYQILCDEGVTILNQTPSAFRQLVEAQRQSDLTHRLRAVIFGGEALEPAMLKPWYEQARNRNTQLVNMYGITETTVHVTYRALASSDTNRAGVSPIGHPIPDLSVYILDPHGAPVPPGVTGEMYVAGAGVARGYLNRPELTAERFLTDPFAGRPMARMYRTGDLARRLPNGEIEYLGRNDMQVKLRGFRIELGEIEARLAEHPAVREAAVVARDNGPDDKRLIAYLTARTDFTQEEALQLAHEHIAEWSRLYDQTYDDKSFEQAKPGFNFVGWRSSYTHQPIPDVEMHEWLDATLRRVRGLNPRRVLEIGCGTGMILLNVAPACERYVGTDLSRKTVEQLSRHIRSDPELNARIVLVHGNAADLSGVPQECYDTVILNSVVQYFPNSEYLFEVLAGAAGKVAAGGRIFIGDVRHHGLLEAFHLSVQLAQPTPGLSTAQLRTRIRQKARQDPELLLDPEWFMSLRENIPGISAVQILPKESAHQNEMSAYRYDVVLTIAAPADTEHVPHWIDCDAAGWGAAEIGRAIIDSPHALIGLRSVFNPRVGPVARMLDQIQEGQPSPGTIDAGRDSLAEAGMTCADLAGFCRQRGYLFELSWYPTDKSGAYHAVVSKSGTLPVIDWQHNTPAPVAGNRLSHANDPLQAKRLASLQREVRAHLALKLPEHMVPAAIHTLDALPLTVNGKLDRNRLLEEDAPVHAPHRYEAPVGEIETELAAIWAELLKVPRVGRSDDFFALGGHSLLGTKLIARVAHDMGVEISIQDLFSRPTLATLSERIVNLLLADLTPGELDGEQAGSGAEPPTLSTLT